MASKSRDYGTTGWETTADHNNLSFDASDDATFEVWVYPTASPTGNGMVNSNGFPICSKWQPAQTREYCFEYGKLTTGGGEYVILLHCTDDGTTNAGHYKSGYVALSGALPLDTWSFIAGTYTDSTGTFEVWIGDENTTPVSVGTDTGFFGLGLGTGGTSRFNIGYGDNVSNGTWDGLMDDFRMWGVKRTQSEIQNNYSPGSITSGTGLKVLWDFNDNVTDLVASIALSTGAGSPSYSTNFPVVLLSQYDPNSMQPGAKIYSPIRY